MTRARQNANISPAVGRNMLINGSMNVAQKATSVTGLGATANSTHTVDRWQTNVGSTAGRFTMTQTADGPNGISANCLKIDCTTADTSIAAAEAFILHQGIEGQNLQRIGKGVAGAKQITASFYVKASAAFTFALELFDGDNNRQITKLFDTTTDWVRHEITFPADVDDGSSPFDDDNAASLDFGFWIHAGATFTGGTLNTASWANYTNANRAVGIDSIFSNTANNFFLTGVQLEVGPVATEFEQEDIGVTQNKCFRYYYKWESDAGFNFVAAGYGTSNTTSLHTFHLPVEMRAVPTFAATGNWRICSNACIDVNLAANALNTKTPSIIAPEVNSGTNVVAGNAYNLGDRNDATADLAWEAEL